MNKIIILIFFATQLISANTVLDVAKKELDRNFKELQKEELPPYYISYNITDVNSFSLISRFGNLIRNNSENSRILDVDLRVGDYSFDNTHLIRGLAFDFGSANSTNLLPIEDKEKALKVALWYATDKDYKSAIERYEKALTNKAVKIEEEDLSGDFTKENKVEYFGYKDSIFDFNSTPWIEKINRLSSMFSDIEMIFDGQVSLQIEKKRKYFVNTEGSKISWDESSARIFVYCNTKAEDGMSLPLYESYYSKTLDGLPSEEKIKKDILNLRKTLLELREAPTMTTFSGPAILSGDAAGVFFHEIFGHRVEGHREKDPNSSQTFKQSINKKILPDFIDIVFDPTKKKLGEVELSGYYKYDDEGVKAQRVVSVDGGVFKSFLMSRSPIEGFSKSNGHGRKQEGYKAVSRQSNLIVSSKVKKSFEELREELLVLCKESEKDFGLYFEKVQGGFTFTNRTIPNAFNVQPLVVYKIYADGRPDELVRGVDLIGTPLSTFNNIVSASNNTKVFNGVCGAESGGVPVSAASPDLLVSNIEVQKKKKSQSRLPILQSPLIENEPR